MEVAKETNEIWHKGSLGNEDDAWTSNTRTARRYRIDENASKHVTSVVVTALCNQPEASNLVDDQSRYLYEVWN